MAVLTLDIRLLSYRRIICHEVCPVSRYTHRIGNRPPRRGDYIVESPIQCLWVRVEAYCMTVETVLGVERPRIQVFLQFVCVLRFEVPGRISWMARSDCQPCRYIQRWTPWLSLSKLLDSLISQLKVL